MRRIKNSKLCQCYLNNLFGVVPIAQLVEVTDSAVLGGVVEVVSSNPTRVINIFSAFTGMDDLFYPFTYMLFCFSQHQSVKLSKILCSISSLISTGTDSLKSYYLRYSGLIYITVDQIVLAPEISQIYVQTLFIKRKSAEIS